MIQFVRESIYIVNLTNSNDAIYIPSPLKADDREENQ